MDTATPIRYRVRFLTVFSIFPRYLSICQAAATHSVLRKGLPDPNSPYRLEATSIRKAPTMQDDDYLWIMAPLVAAEREAPKPGRARLYPRLIRRTWQSPRKLSGEGKRVLINFGKMVGLWAALDRERLVQHLPEAVVQRLIDLAPNEYVAEPKAAQLFTNLFLLETRAVIQSEVVDGKLEFDVSGEGVHAYTTRPWLQWIRDPLPAAECEYCGWVFVPSRMGMKFCSNSCRVGAAKARANAAPENGRGVNGEAISPDTAPKSEP